MKFRFFLFVCVCLLGFGLATESALAADEETSAEGPVFYPPPPNLPRMQFLRKFASIHDVSVGKSGGFRSFVFGDEDTEEQALNKPFGLDIYEGAIFAVDSRGDGYVVFDLKARKWRTVTGKGDGKMPKPINITIDEDGLRYITDTKRNLVLVYDTNDRFLRSYNVAGQFRPIDVAVSEGRLYISDAASNIVHVLDKVSGETLFAFGGGGTEPGKMVHPTGLAVGPDGTIYVVDTTNFRVQQFTPDGELIRVIGGVGVGVGKFVRPKGIDVDREGRVYVVDGGLQLVQIFNEANRVLMYFGGSGDGPGDMYLPTTVTIDYDNVDYFREYAAPGFELEYIVLVANQFGPNKVAVYGFGSEVD